MFFGIPVELLLQAGAYGILLILVGAVLKVGLEYWKDKRPQLVEDRKEGIELKKTLMRNSETLTHTISSMKEMLDEHSIASAAEARRGAATVESACGRLDAIETQMSNHTKAAETAIETFREVFSEEFPELHKRMHIDSKCNEMLLALRNQQND